MAVQSTFIHILQDQTLILFLHFHHSILHCCFFNVYLYISHTTFFMFCKKNLNILSYDTVLVYAFKSLSSQKGQEEEAGGKEDSTGVKEALWASHREAWPHTGNLYFIGFCVSLLWRLFKKVAIKSGILGRSKVKNKDLSWHSLVVSPESRHMACLGKC